MDASMIARIVSLVPERVARVPGGTAFSPHASACRYPERIAHLGQFLNWLAPLASLSKEDQRILGLLNAAGRPVHAIDLEDEAEELADDEPLSCPLSAAVDGDSASRFE
jgi:hypothetical protein